MYYQRQHVKGTIVDFASSKVSSGFRECAVYNSKTRSVQRYFGESGSRHPISFGTADDLEKAVGAGASAFYCSFWYYDGADFSKPVGRDLAWTVRANIGGIEFVKLVTAKIVKALEEAGVSEPWVKYSGDLGFDIVVPLESIPWEAWWGDPASLNELQGEITDFITDCVREPQLGGFSVERGKSIKIKKAEKICLLSELRVGRGLLLAPMSLNPETRMVSVPVDPDRVESFSVLDSSPERVGSSWWAPPTSVAYGLLKLAKPWQLAAMGAATAAQA
ncbi:MAG: hypothetical protein AB1305_00840 [Candidatus Hadarchaeota archaeon]